MKIITQTDSLYLIRFDKGEAVFKVLKQFCLEEKIQAASFHAIGACEKLTVSYYNLQTKKYQDSFITEDLEIASVIGNVASLNGELIIHAHGVFAKDDLSTVGGHIKDMIVSATCEVTLTALPGDIQRAYDEETGLNLLT